MPTKPSVLNSRVLATAAAQSVGCLAAFLFTENSGSATRNLAIGFDTPFSGTNLPTWGTSADGPVLVGSRNPADTTTAAKTAAGYIYTALKPDTEDFTVVVSYRSTSQANVELCGATRGFTLPSSLDIGLNRAANFNSQNNTVFVNVVLSNMTDATNFSYVAAFVDAAVNDGLLHTITVSKIGTSVKTYFDGVQKLTTTLTGPYRFKMNAPGAPPSGIALLAADGGFSRRSPLTTDQAMSRFLFYERGFTQAEVTQDIATPYAMAAPVGGGEPAPPPVVTPVAITPTTATVVGGATQQFVGSGASAYTYVTTAGTISASGLFTAPASTNAIQTITVTVRDAADVTRTATATITVPATGAAPVVVPVAISPTTATVAGGATQQFAASGANAYTYLAGAGSINASGLFTAPASTSVIQTITVTARDSADATRLATATITVPATVVTLPGSGNGTTGGGGKEHIIVFRNGDALAPGLTPVFTTCVNITTGADVVPPAIVALKNGLYKYVWDANTQGEMAGVINGGDALPVANRELIVRHNYQLSDTSYHWAADATVKAFLGPNSTATKVDLSPAPNNDKIDAIHDIIGQVPGGTLVAIKNDPGLKLERMLQTNRKTFNSTTNILTVFNDDNTTIFKQFQLVPRVGGGGFSETTPIATLPTQ